MIWRKVLCKIGTLAHNKDFTARDISEYVGVDGSAAVRKMKKHGLLKSVSRGRYYPTPKGWRTVEGACRLR
jgi:Mn-dependent DtxR family transcriptional regulator